MKSNLYSELLDYCTDRAKCKYCNNPTTILYELITNKKIEENLEDFDLILKGEGDKFKAPWVNLSEFEM